MGYLIEFFTEFWRDLHFNNSFLCRNLNAYLHLLCNKQCILSSSAYIYVSSLRKLDFQYGYLISGFFVSIFSTLCLSHKNLLELVLFLKYIPLTCLDFLYCFSYFWNIHNVRLHYSKSSITKTIKSKYLDRKKIVHPQ